MSRFRVPVLCAAWLLAARLPGQDLTIVSKTTFGNAEGTSTHSAVRFRRAGGVQESPVAVGEVKPIPRTEHVASSVSRYKREEGS